MLRLLVPHCYMLAGDAGKGTLAGEGGEEHAARRLGSRPGADYDGLGVPAVPASSEAVWGPVGWGR